MPPRKEIWDELTRIWGQAEPIKADPPRPNDPDRTREIILKTAAIAFVITAVVITAGVNTASTFIYSNSNPGADRPSPDIDKPTLNTIPEYLLAYQKTFRRATTWYWQ